MIVEAEWIWIVVVAFVVSFGLAFGIGANDVANSFGTSVGSKVLTHKQACVLGTIFEILGAILVGSKVSDTIRKGIISVDSYDEEGEVLFMLGNLAALIGSCIWLLVATFLKLPVSTTHSIVGATLGFSLVAQGSNGVGWVKLAMIVGSWFISPILAGGVSVTLFLLINKFVLQKVQPLESGLFLLPFFYAFTLAINLFSIFYDGSELLHFHNIPLYGTFILTFGPAILAGVLVRCIIVPWQRRKIQAKVKSCEKLIHSGTSLPEDSVNKSENVKVPNIDLQQEFVEAVMENEKKKKDTVAEIADQEVQVQIATEDGEEDKDEHETVTRRNAAVSQRQKARDDVFDKPETAILFSFLQILTAVFGSFAHGGNDVSNAIGPLVALWIAATTGSVAQKAPVPIWILLYGGVGISIGLWLWGRRVMKTMGEDLTKITPSSGFCIEIGSAFTVLVASNVGIPISSTHCKVGSVVFVGRARSKESVDWSLFRNIIIAWFGTLPVSAGLSAGVMKLLMTVVK